MYLINKKMQVKYFDEHEGGSQLLNLEDFIVSSIQTKTHCGYARELTEVEFSYSKFLKIQFNKGLITFEELLEILNFPEDIVSNYSIEK